LYSERRHDVSPKRKIQTFPLNSFQLIGIYSKTAFKRCLVIPLVDLAQFWQRKRKSPPACQISHNVLYSTLSTRWPNQIHQKQWVAAFSFNMNDFLRNRMYKFNSAIRFFKLLKKYQQKKLLYFLVTFIFRFIIVVQSLIEKFRCL